MHIMGSSMAAADSWFHSPSNTQASAHFGIGNDGHIVQWVDTDDKAWHACKANPNYWGIETEGTSGPLTNAQVESFAKLYGWLESLDHFGFALADSPGQHGLGWHGMGGVGYCNHPYCPGDQRKAQRSLILQLAQQGGTDMTPEEDQRLRNVEAVVGQLLTIAQNVQAVIARIDNGTEGIDKDITAIKTKVGA
jgi:hypothetical protein